MVEIYQEIKTKTNKKNNTVGFKGIQGISEREEERKEERNRPRLEKIVLELLGMLDTAQILQSPRTTGV